VNHAARSDVGAAPAWTLPLLLAAGALTALDNVWDAGVIKIAVCALLAGALLLPALAWRGRDAIGAWFTSAGGRLLLLSTALALPMAWEAVQLSTVTDRMLLFGLANVAAVSGLAAARARPGALGWSVTAVAAVAAGVCLAQAAGLEQTLTPGPEEVVGLAGNSIRAGALCALGLVAAAGRLLVPAGATARSALSSVLAGGGVALISAALLLTRARGARWVALAALLVLLVLAWRRHGAGLRRGALTLALALLAGLAVAAAVGGSDALSGRKLEQQAPILSGRDLTTGVRLELYRGALQMLADHPGLGVGFGRYAQHAGAYRSPDEAALPGLAGGITVAEHPHNELLLAFVEGGWPAGLLLLALLVLALRRAWRRAARCEGHAGLVDLGLLATGMLLGLGQDAWSDPGTALVFFAALGAAFSATPAGRADGEAPHPSEIPHPSDRAALPGLAGALLALLLGAGLIVGAWPRLDAHMSLRSFLLRTEAEGRITPTGFHLLQHAAETAPGDEAVQRLLLDFGQLYLPTVYNDDGKEQVQDVLFEAQRRLHALAPIPGDGR